MNGQVPAPTIKGWCPGALQPMQSGDGLIVRLKIPLGIVGTALARKIADWSRRCGNGVIELSARGNLQLRGVSPEGLVTLQAAMAEADLLDADPRGEAVRNILLSPLSGIDPDAVLDVQPMARQLDRVLRNDTRLHALPGKFGFAIDDGGSFGPGAADVSFLARQTQDGPGFVIELAGEPTLRFGPCMPRRLPDVAVSLALAFFAGASRQAGAIRRMRDLVASVGAPAIAEAAGLAAVALNHPPASRPEPRSLLGPHAIGPAAFVGVGLPFGQTHATDLADLAKSAAAFGAGELRLTPWRAIFIPVSSSEAATALANDQAAGSFILDPADPRRRVAACVGAPRCLHASTPVREHAAVLASRLAAIPGCPSLVHVSGCAKGCANPLAAPLTLVGRDGAYDIVLHGTAAGVPVLAGLTLEQAAAFMSASTENVFR